MSFVLWHCLTTADSREISWDFIFAMPTMAANWCRRLNLLRHWPQIRQGVGMAAIVSMFRKPRDDEGVMRKGHPAVSLTSIAK